MPLAEFQAGMHKAIVGGDAAAMPALIAGNCDPVARFAIHRRHYEASLMRALGDKFPALGWIAGESRMSAAARSYVHAHPPQAPCIADYGRGFPGFLAAHAGAAEYPWLAALGDLEWWVGRAAIAIDSAPLAVEALAAVAPDRLADCRLTLQQGVFYCEAAWPVDELIALFVAGDPPDWFRFEPSAVRLEVRGARGRYAIARLEPGEFVFRRALGAGATIAEAAERGLDADDAFDPGRALMQAAGVGLVIAIADPIRGPLS